MGKERLFDGVFRIEGRICTKNLVKGKTVYGERLLNEGRDEYRAWNPHRSKLAAAILLGLKSFKITKDSDVLYLGAATGTTSSHISDIVGAKGTVYCVEISERNMRDLFKVCEQRSNMMPIFGDAMDTQKYAENVGQVDAIYQDVSSRDQDEILVRNGAFLRSGGLAYVAIKSQSIDVSKKPKYVYDEFIRNVSGSFELIEAINLDRYDKKHLFVVLRKLSR